MAKLVTPWTHPRLAARIREGEQLLDELADRPPWMRELLARDLVLKRRLLAELEGEIEAA